MAEVLRPISQTDILQNRPASANTFQVAMSGSPQKQSRAGQIPRNHFSSHTVNSGYRGVSAAPIPPYAFKTTSQLRQDNRAVSLPPAQALQSPANAIRSTHNRQRYPAPDSISSVSSMSSIDPPAGANVPYSKDDALLFTNYQAPVFSNDPRSIENVDVTSGFNTHVNPSPKPSPERFRRGHRRGESSVASGVSDGSAGSPSISTATVGQRFHNVQQVSVLSPHERPLFSGPPEIPKRFRGRNHVSSLESKPKVIPSIPSVTTSRVPTSGAFVQHLHQDEARPPTATSIVQRPESSAGVAPSVVSPDIVRRTNNPPTQARPPTAESHHSSGASPSPAVVAMAALNERDSGKGVKSRLRRVFSFSSSADLKMAANEPDNAVERAKVRQEEFSHLLDDEQNDFTPRQGATTPVTNVYGGRGNAFTASTDNISISSTASSASLMLRKMGTGMRKGGRSLKGLFRPKSVVGIPSVDASLQASVGPISFINVEAEREQVNVNADPHEKAGGGTGFPRLENNSIDMGRTSISSADFRNTSVLDSRDSELRRGVIGIDERRTEVPAGSKRGILKPSPSPSPVAFTGGRNEELYLPGSGSKLERVQSPAVGATNTERRSPLRHKRTNSPNINGDEYFSGFTAKSTGLRTSKSLPGTPHDVAKSITFSPRIQFFDVWSPTDYDRRGEIATCNRLTPLLAQQIKEELNNFKMEMEVHELSKPYTHFF